MMSYGGVGSNIPVSNGKAVVGLREPVTEFQRVQVTEPTPLTQVDFSYGVPSGAFVDTSTSGTGTVAGHKGYATVSTGGTAAGAYATIFSARNVRFRDGQGCEAYVVSKLDTPQAGTVQLVGVFTSEDGYGAGYGYDDDGVTPSVAPCVHIKSGGVRQIETLTLSGASGAGTVNITLSGVTTNVAVTAATLARNAWELASASYPGWRSYSLGSTVVFIAESVGALAGGAYASASGSPCAGAFATTTTGSLGTDVWVTQPNWNVDPLDGTGPSGATVDPGAWNTLRITYSDTSAEWAWYAEGRFVPFHRHRSASSVTITNSAMPIQAVCYNVAGVAASKSVSVGGMAGMLSGSLRRIGARRGDSASVSGVTTTKRPLVSYRLTPYFSGPSTATAHVFTGEVTMRQVTIANVGSTNGAVVDLVVNANIVAPNWTQVAGASAGTGSGMNRDVASTAFTPSGTPGGVTIASYVVAPATSIVVDLDSLDLVVLKNQTVTFAAKSDKNTTDVVIAASWIEER